MWRLASSIFGPSTPLAAGRRIRYTSDRLDRVEGSFAAGEAHWHEADEHAVVNTGTTEARFVIFQFKG